MPSFAAFISSIVGEIDQVITKLASVSKQMAKIKRRLDELQLSIEAFAELKPEKLIELESGLSASSPLRQSLWQFRELLPRLELVIRIACGQIGIQLDQIRSKIISAKTTFAGEESSSECFFYLDNVVRDLDELCSSLASAPDIYHAQFSLFLNS